MTNLVDGILIAIKPSRINVDCYYKHNRYEFMKWPIFYKVRDKTITKCTAYTTNTLYMTSRQRISVSWSVTGIEPGTYTRQLTTDRQFYQLLKKVHTIEYTNQGYKLESCYYLVPPPPPPSPPPPPPCSPL